MRLPWRFGLVAALLLFLFFGDVPEASRFWSAFFDAGHTALFGVIALVVHHWVASRRRAASPAGNRLAAFAITVTLGAATEVLQTLQARGDPSIIDLMRDTAGAGAFLLVGWAVSRWRSAWTRERLAALALAALLLVAAGWTLMRTSACYVARDRAYPTLFNLDGSWWESEFVELKQNRLTPGARTISGDDGQALRLARLDLAPGLYSGITFDEPYPDWRGRDALAWTIVSDLDQPLPIVIRVHDAAHDQRFSDRFNRRFTIAPGVNRLRIPIDDIRNAPDRRKMDLRRVRGVILFAFDLKKPASLFLGPLHLE
jgi:hypothetical protein